MIYLDFNSSTPLLPEARAAMEPYWHDHFGNPSSSHSAGRKARQAVGVARDRIAALLHAFPDEIVFTSGATESNNLALFGLAARPGKFLAAEGEHPCVVEPLRRLAEQGRTVEYHPLGRDGIIPFEEFRARMSGDTAAVIAATVNHETGAVHHMTVPSDGPPLHVDAAQAIGKVPFHFHEARAATAAVSPHKFGGPKGVGLLLIRRWGVKIAPQFFGGHQQQGRRPGTENVPGIVGTAAALQVMIDRLDVHRERCTALRTRFLDRLHPAAEPFVVNSPLLQASPFVVNVSFPGCPADLLLMKLDLAGIACSTGSACSSGSLLPSPVLQSMGVPDDVLRSAMRFSFFPTLTDAEIDESADRIGECVQQIRSGRSHGGL